MVRLLGRLAVFCALSLEEPNRAGSGAVSTISSQKHLAKLKKK